MSLPGALPAAREGIQPKGGEQSANLLLKAISLLVHHARLRSRFAGSGLRSSHAGAASRRRRRGGADRLLFCILVLKAGIYDPIQSFVPEMKRF
jgi:hypothetical protein